MAVAPAVDELFPTFLAAHELWKWWHAGEVAYQQKREEEKARLAQSNSFNPTMPSTDGIKGQSMAEVVSGLDQTNSTDANSEASGTAVQPAEAPATENQVSQAELQKKPGFFGRLFGKK